jgi:REP element-mobilizing transposase RayT
MKRKRILIPESTTVYHLICRTAYQSFIFKDQEKAVFVSLMLQQARFAGIEILAYCVMSNHVHLLVRVPPIHSLPDNELLARYRDYYGTEKVPQSTFSVNELEAILREGGSEADMARARILARMGDLPAFMRELKQRFTIWYNHKHENQGTIWAARYKSLIVENAPESLTRVAAYIDLNPVRAELVGDPQDYRWCGYAAAVAGVPQAKMAIQTLFANDTNFTKCLTAYRLILFGKGYGTKGAANKDLGRISAEALDEVIRSQGHVDTADLLRMRIRYFADGAAIGSKAFVEEVFQQNREEFGARRQRAGKALPPKIWGDLHVLRDLKKNVYR